MTNNPEQLSSRDIQRLIARAHREKSVLAHQLTRKMFHSLSHAWRSYTAPKPLGGAT
jgi:hypothetical protein